MCNWAPAVRDTGIFPQLKLCLLGYVLKSTKYSTLVNYFHLPICLLQPSVCPQTTNGLAPIPKTQVLLVCQKDPPPHKLSLRLAEQLFPPPLFTKYSQPWRSAGPCLPDYHDWLGVSNSPKSHPHTWNPSVVDPQLPRNLEQGVG